MRNQNKRKNKLNNRHNPPKIVMANRMKNTLKMQRDFKTERKKKPR